MKQAEGEGPQQGARLEPDDAWDDGDGGGSSTGSSASASRRSCRCSLDYDSPSASPSSDDGRSPAGCQGQRFNSSSRSASGLFDRSYPLHAHQLSAETLAGSSRTAAFSRRDLRPSRLGLSPSPSLPLLAHPHPSLHRQSAYPHPPPF